MNAFGLEFGLFASKIDVDEELSRLRAHLEEVESILFRGGATGKAPRLPDAGA